MLGILGHWDKGIDRCLRVCSNPLQGEIMIDPTYVQIASRFQVNRQVNQPAGSYRIKRTGIRAPFTVYTDCGGRYAVEWKGMPIIMPRRRYSLVWDVHLFLADLETAITAHGCR